MTSAWSQLEQMLTCAICLDRYKNPRLLPCQHSFCGDACMEGLVDYARRQIKCPECRAEHRIPYQGVSSLPSNVTLIRFLELHARITGEEPEPVPTFMEKCSVCGEKVDGVQRCAHCEKKVCPECKEAHLDLLRREINRVNGQSKRCFGKMQEFRETLAKSEERLQANRKSVRRDIEESCRRLVEDLQAKQRRLLEEVDAFAEQEQKTIDKLKVAIVDELEALESNARLADEKLVSPKYQWVDQELAEAKEIYAKAMEFARLFDPEIGDYTRKMRFNLIPEFDSLRRRICELGELKFAETATALIASSLQYCNATGSVAVELCQTAAAQAAAQAANSVGAGGYGLSHSNSNANLGAGSAVGGGGGSTMLELPSMQNALMRSQSDHRLASQFQQRLKQQQIQDAAGKGTSSGGYGSVLTSGSSRSRAGAAVDYETESLRSRYAPRGSTGGKDYDLLRDWPRPGDNDGSELSFGSSIQFKSAFMRRKEKERQQYGGYGAGYNDDDDDLTSEASYGGMSGTGRNVRFYESAADQATGGSSAPAKQVPRLFDVKEVERAPLSGVPKLENSAHLHERLHQMGAKAVVDKKHAEEDSKRDKDLVESARQAMDKVKSAALRLASEDEIEKQKRANKQREDQLAQQITATNTDSNSTDSNSSSRRRAPSSRSVRVDPAPDEPAHSSPRHSPTPSADLNSGASTVVEAVTPPSPAAVPGGRRGLYGAAVTEKSRRQLTSAIQDAANYTPRRRSIVSADSGEQPAPVTPEATSTASSSSAGGSTRPKRMLRSTGRSLSKQASSDRQLSVDGVGSSRTTRRRKTLARAESSQQSFESPQPQDESQSKNYSTGSGGTSDNNAKTSTSADLDTKLTPGRQPVATGASGSARASYSYDRASTLNTSATADQTSTTTDDDDGDDKDPGRERKLGARSTFEDDLDELDDERRPWRRSAGSTPTARQVHSATGSDSATKPAALSDSDESSDGDDDDNRSSQRGARNAGNRRSRELMPNAVNKLLDRSAQIRRDSQEQRSRGDSPQRSTPKVSSYNQGESSREHQYATPSQSSFYGASSAATRGVSGASGYTPSASGISSSTRSRLAYQRSQSIHDDDTANSNNSIYTTASSTSGGQRRSSNEDEPTSTSTKRVTSGNSTDRTLTYEPATPTTRGLYRRESSGDSNATSGGFQSRFLSRSRTSAALSSAASGSGNRSQDGGETSARQSVEDSPRSYLSSRDRFMQSTAGISSASGSVASSTGGSAGSYSGRASTGSGSGTPSAGIKTHSEYLRNKFSRRASSNSSAISPSTSTQGRSSQSAYNNSGDSDDSDIEPSRYYGIDSTRRKSSIRAADVSDQDTGRKDSFTGLNRSRGLRKDSQTDAGIESASGKSNPYSSKGRMLFKLGTRGSDPGNFTWPRGVAVGYGNRGREIIVADSSNHRVQVFDSSGRFLNEFGSYGSGAAEFDCLAGIAVNKTNKNYIVSDRYNHRVQIFDSTGKFLRSFGEMGRDAGKFNLPWGVAVDSMGRIYVCDKENHRIQVFDSNGFYLDQFGLYGTQPGQLQHPHYIAAGMGKVVVTDTNNHRVQLFDYNGRLINTIGKEGSSDGQFKFPRGVAMDDQGYIIVGDSGNNRLQVFSADGLVKTVGTWGSAEGEFKGIEGVAVDIDTNILVCDRENHRIQVF